MKVHGDEDFLIKNRKCAPRSSQNILPCGQLCSEVILIYHRLLARSFKQHEHYTFYGLVAAIPKEVPILGAETRVFLSPILPYF